MHKLHLLGGVLLFALVGTSLAYVVGTGYLSFRYGFNGEYLDWTWIATGYFAIKNNDPQAFRILNLIWGGFIILSLLFSAKVLTEGLTTFGRAHWQSRRELRANKFFKEPGRGFVVGKIGSPKGRGKFLCSASFPHCLLVAPTGAGNPGRPEAPIDRRHRRLVRSLHPARCAGSYTVRQWPGVHRKGGAGMDRRRRREDRLHRAGVPLGERLL